MILTRQEIKRRQRRLDSFYREPDPLDTAEQADQFAHRDLLTMSRADLLAERWRVRRRLLDDPDPKDWFLQRAAAIEQALRHAP